MADVIQPAPAVRQPDLPVLPRQPGAGARLVAFEPWPLPNPSLAGHATIDFSGWIVAKIPIFRGRDGGLSVGSPSYPKIDADGRVRVDEVGKRQYSAAITFGNHDAKWRFTRAVLGALEAAGVQP